VAGSGSSLAIGSPVTSGTATDVLFVDGSGNLGQNSAFTFSASTTTLTVPQINTVANSPLVLEFPRTAPTTVNDYVEIGSFYSPTGYGACLLSLDVSLNANGISASKSYRIATAYRDLSGSWLTLTPMAIGQNNLNTDFVVDINVDFANVYYLRYRTIGFGPPAGVTARFRVTCMNNDTAFIPSTGTGTQTPIPTATYNCIYAGQTQGTIAAGSIGVEQEYTIVRPASFNVSYPQVASINVGRWGTAVSYSPNTRLDFALKSTSTVDYIPNVTVMTLQDDVSVGIGTTTPGAALHAVANTTGKIGLILQQASGSSANFLQAEGSTGTPITVIRPDGSIGLPTLTDSAAVNSSLYFSSTTSKLTYKDASGTLHAI
jgi:hypothetical protein